LQYLECRVTTGSFKPSPIPNEADERRAQERASSGQILRREDRKAFEIHEFKGVPRKDARGNSIGESYDGTRVTTESNWKNNAQQVVVVNTFRIWHDVSETFSQKTEYRNLFRDRLGELKRDHAFKTEPEKQVYNNTNLYSSPNFAMPSAQFSA